MCSADLHVHPYLSACESRHSVSVGAVRGLDHRPELTIKLCICCACFPFQQ